VRLGCKGKRTRLADGAHDDVLALVAAEGDARVGQIRQAAQQPLQLVLFGTHLCIQRVDALAHALHLGDLGLACGRLFHLADLAAHRIAQRLERFDLGQQRAPALVELDDQIQWSAVLPVGDGLAHLVQMRTHIG
jgi:hypothetical protein